jgi:hypothetical protein
MLILARCDKAGRVDDPWDRGFTPVGPRDVSAPAESQVIGISGLRAVGYTLGFIVGADGFELGPCPSNPDVLPISPWLE